MWFFLSLFFALWTSISISIVKRLTKDVSSLHILLANNLFVLPFMFTIILSLGGIPKVSPQFYVFVLFSSVIDLVAFLASLWAIRHSPISLISPIASFNPVFTTLFAAFALSELPSPSKLLGIVVVVCGTYLLNLSDIKHGIFVPFKKLFSHKGVQLFLLANFLWGITPIFQKQAIFATSPYMPIFPSFFGSLLLTLFILPFVLKKKQQATIEIRKNIGWFLLLAPFSALAQWAAYSAFSLTNVGYATAIFKLSTLFTILWGALFFKEERIKERLLGAIVMILGTILLVI